MAAITKEKHAFLMLARIAETSNDPSVVTRTFSHLKLADWIDPILESVIEGGVVAGRGLADLLASTDSSLLDRVEEFCNRPAVRWSRALRPAALAATTRLVELQPDLEQYDPAQFANLMNNHGVRLGEVGSYEQAITSHRTAVAALYRLGTAGPRLGLYLANLANALQDCRLWEEAEKVGEKAVENLKAKNAEDEWWNEWASALLALANARAARHRLREAELASAQVVSNLEELIRRAPSLAVETQLSRALVIHGEHLWLLGRTDAAVAAGLQALELRRRLCGDDADVHGADLAETANKVGVWLLNKDETLDRAGILFEEAIDYWLRNGRSAIEASSWAQALSNLALLEARQHRLRRARTLLHRALRGLAKWGDDQIPIVETKALCHFNLPGIDQRSGLLKSARRSIRRCLEIRRQLGRSREPRYLALLAATLTTWSQIAAEIGQDSAAIAAGREAVELLRPLADSSWSATRESERALTTLATRLRGDGEAEQAFELLQEALELANRRSDSRRELALDRARILNNLAALSTDLRRPEEAIAATRKALDLLETHEIDPEILILRATLLENLSGDLAACRQGQEACDRATAAVAARQELFERGWQTDRAALVGAKSVLADAQRQAGLHLIALHNLEATAQEMEQQTELSPAEQEALGRIFLIQARLLQELGRLHESEILLVRASFIYKELLRHSSGSLRFAALDGLRILIELSGALSEIN